MRALTYCSFADDTRCLGVVILEGALDPGQAAIRAHALGVNPGGELLALPIYEDNPDLSPGLFDRMAANVNRLVPLSEARDLFNAVRIGDWVRGGGNA